MIGVTSRTSYSSGSECFGTKRVSFRSGSDLWRSEGSDGAEKRGCCKAMSVDWQEIEIFTQVS